MGAKSTCDLCPRANAKHAHSRTRTLTLTHITHGHARRRHACVHPRPRRRRRSALHRPHQERFVIHRSAQLSSRCFPLYHPRLCSPSTSTHMLAPFPHTHAHTHTHTHTHTRARVCETSSLYQAANYLICTHARISYAPAAPRWSHLSQVGRR
jgi:hypothetical protein